MVRDLRKLRSLTLASKNSECKTEATNSIKTLKLVHVNKKKKRRSSLGGMLRVRGKAGRLPGSVIFLMG